MASTIAQAGDSDLEAERRQWHEKREARLKSEDGWLSLVGLYWLNEGPNRFGSAKDNELVFPPKAPAHLGTLTLHGKDIAVEVAPGVQMTKDGKPFAGGVSAEHEGKSDVLGWGTLHFYVIRRGDKFGIRLKDSEAEARKAFHGIPLFPVNPKWRINARFEPATQPRTMEVPNVLGTVESLPSPGSAAFSVDGKEYRLDPVAEGDTLFFIFGDETNRNDTYGAGRFLYAEMPKNGQVVLDFNRAINPPCAFSLYATCPLPPKQNKLALRIEAGEKRYGNH